MTRHRTSSAAVLAVLAVSVAWLGAAVALASADGASTADFLDERAYLVSAVVATAAGVAACLRCWHWGALATVGATAGLWWGGVETVRRTHGAGWGDGWWEYAVFLVPVAAGFVTVVAVVTCAAAGTCPSPSRRRPSPADAQP